MRITLSKPLKSADAVRLFPAEYRPGSGLDAAALTTDSREVHPGDLFLAIPGKNANGASFIDEAMARGASGVLIDDCRLSVVTRLAHLHRLSHKAKIIAVTGSVGKTSTKECLFSLLSQKYRVFKTQGNENNELGVPLTLLSAKEDDEIGIVELGMRAAGEISALSKCVLPDIGVITVIGRSHIETLGSTENICRAKFEILDGMTENGRLFLGEKVVPPDGLSPLCPVTALSGYGTKPPCYFGIRPTESGSFFTVRTENAVYEDLFLPLYGNHHVKNAALALLVGEALGLSAYEIRKGLAACCQTPMRTALEKRDGIYVISDCYNASPESMAAAADVLKNLKGTHPGARAFALLGDMLELGDDSISAHREVGALFGSLPIGGIYAFGKYAFDILSGAKEQGFRGTLSEDPYGLAEILKSGDILLVKASRGMKAELLTDDILKKRKEKE